MKDKDTSKTLEGIEEEFDKEFLVFNNNLWHAYKSDTPTGEDIEMLGNYEEIKQFYRTQIKDLLESVVPPEQTSQGNYEAYNFGWNQAIAEIRVNIKRIL